MSRKSMIGSVLILALLLVGTLGGFVFAKSTSGDDDPAARMKETTQLFITTLAGNLGISVDDLTTALEKTQQDMLNAQVTAGEITQDDADKAIERGLEIGFMGGFGPGGAPPDGQNGQGGKGKPAGPPPGESSDDSE